MMKRCKNPKCSYYYCNIVLGAVNQNNVVRDNLIINHTAVSGSRLSKENNMGRVFEDFLENINKYTDEEIREMAPDLTDDQIRMYKEDSVKNIEEDLNG